MVFYLESQGHTKTVVNGKVVDNRGYEAVSNSKGTNLLIKEGKKKYLFQDNPLLNAPASSASLIVRLNNDFLGGKKKKTRQRRKRQKKRTTRKH